MSNLIIDIGNTALKAAWADGVILGKTFRYQGEKMSDFIMSLVSKEKPDVMIISSVREISRQNEERFRKECGRLVLMDPRHVRYAEKYGLPSCVTPDRAASIVAARHLFKGKGCVVFDLGTTMTVDFIGADGSYGGGVISPGCRTRFRALNRYSRSLPLADAPEHVQDRGNDIITSIQSGVVKGIIFEIEGYLGQIPDYTAVFTGGDAIYFAKRMKNSIFVVCNLVLVGLALMAEDYVEEDL